ncbi:sec-independent (periplasmic) protein translocase protein TatC [Legionella beliardensis]|uniref:Sec-independent protein translocase protein TatC n=1 Tax=Legionella beliardensis TaxID=91822 RepID=A0A378HXB3_9GAMM|nr:twin-arginine translocase subunit TatC [Legionella beliardensis]STX27547.1 sec-independent (periplasmic) protein translocase protein TatC [Legionella beliardensis]
MLRHLIELRQRALLVMMVFLSFFLLFFYFAKPLFYWLVKPLLSILPPDNFIIVTHITAPVLAPINLAANAALLCTSPIALYHIWRFVMPGLYRSERQKLGHTILLSLFLFVLGVLFCFCIVLPFMFQFFTQAVPDHVKMLPDMASTLDFITRMLLLFGFCFQVPLVCLTLVRLNLLSIATLRQIRPYVIVGAFIVGMLLTPPDVLSQVMLAVPLCFLYELGIILACCSNGVLVKKA